MQRFKSLGHDVGLLWLRLLCGGGIAYHGYQKIFERGVENFAPYVAKLGLPFLSPTVWAWGAAGSEFLGGILIALGLFTRIGGAAVLSVMGVAVLIVHKSDPLFAAGPGQASKEMALCYAAMAGAVMLIGAGKYSLDARIAAKKAKKK